MRSEAQINTLAFGQETGYISASKAISDGPDSLDTELIAQVCDRLLDDGLDVGGLVVGNHAVKLSWPSGMSLGIASPANRSGTTVRYPARAYESASLETRISFP